MKTLKCLVTSTYNSIRNILAVMIGKINWKTKRVLSPEEFETIRQKLKDDYYIILSRHDGHLSTYAIALAHCFLTHHWGYYAHVFMNLEDTVLSDNDYRFIEATGTGVHISGFSGVFDDQTSSVALLKPKSMSLDKWTSVMDKAKTELGKPYDTLFDLANDNKLSCVELVRDALRNEPNYETDFANFEAMIADAKNLDPQMFYECSDFVVEYETRH